MTIKRSLAVILSFTLLMGNSKTFAAESGEETIIVQKSVTQNADDTSSRWSFKKIVLGLLCALGIGGILSWLRGDHKNEQKEADHSTPQEGDCSEHEESDDIASASLEDLMKRLDTVSAEEERQRLCAEINRRLLDEEAERRRREEAERRQREEAERRQREEAERRRREEAERRQREEAERRRREEVGAYSRWFTDKFSKCERDVSWRETTVLDDIDMTKDTIRARIRIVFGDAKYKDVNDKDPNGDPRERGVEWFVLDQPRGVYAGRLDQVFHKDQTQYYLFLKSLKVASEMDQEALGTFRALASTQIRGECENQLLDFIGQFATFVDRFSPVPEVATIDDLVSSAVVSAKRSALKLVIEKLVEANCEKVGHGDAVIPEQRNGLYVRYAGRFGLYDYGDESQNRGWIPKEINDSDVIPEFARQLVGDLGSSLTSLFAGLNDEQRSNFYKDLTGIPLNYSEFLRYLNSPISKHAFEQSCAQFGIKLSERDFDKRFQKLLDSNDDVDLLQNWKNGQRIKLGKILENVIMCDGSEDVPELTLYNGNLESPQGAAWLGGIASVIHLAINGYINVR